MDAHPHPSSIEPAPRPQAGGDGARWKRWPCPACGFSALRFSVVCPRCEALPWSGSGEGENLSTLARQTFRPGVQLETRGRRPLYRHHRMSTPTGFLGILSRRLFGGGEWLGVDGHEWRIDRIGPWGLAWVLQEGGHALAAAETKGPWRELLRGGWQIWEGDRSFSLVRAGLARHQFLLVVQDGPEVLRIQGGVVDPLRRIDVLADVNLATIVLAGFLACGLRQGENE